ncbi:MAG TPA: hypothetical protein VMC79_06025 [Rectinemataceae bacterium]|nr:hypothetical protein [Rectinemataceae bacterium]
MSEDKEREFEKRVDDIREIRKMLAEGKETPLIYPWAFYTWGLLTLGGSIVHYYLYTKTGVNIRDALVWIWLPILILGAVSESVSFALKAKASTIALFNHRLGGALLAALASIVILTLVVVRLSLAHAMTPGIIFLVGAFAMAFYAQISYSSLFIEAFGAIAVGLLLEFAGVHSPLSFLLTGIFTGILFIACGIHIQGIERKGHG